MRIIDADALRAELVREYLNYRKRGADVTLYDLSYTLGDILEKVDSAPTVLFKIGGEIVELEVNNGERSDGTE